MLKKIVFLVIAALIVTFAASGVGAAEKSEFKELRLTSVRTEKIDILRYGAAGGSWLAEVVRRLVASGKPGVIFAEEIKGSLEVTLMERLLDFNVDLVGGMTLKNEEPSNFIWGVQYTGFQEESGGIWKIFSKLNPAIYNEKGRWYFGGAYIWQAE